MSNNHQLQKSGWITFFIPLLLFLIIAGYFYYEEVAAQTAIFVLTVTAIFTTLNYLIWRRRQKKYFARLRNAEEERNALIEQSIRLNRVYAFLSSTNQTMIRLHDKKQLLNEACRIAVEQGKFKMAWIGMVDQETHFVNPIAFYGSTEDYLELIKISIDDVPEGRGPTGTAIRQGKYFVCNDIENDERMLPWRERALKKDFRSSIALPIKIEDQIKGVISLYSIEKNFFNKEEIDLLLELASDISYAVEFIEKEEELRKLSQAVKQSFASVMITDINGNIEFANPGFTDLSGYSYEEVIGKNPRLLQSGKTPPEEYEKFWETIKSGNDWYGEICNKKKNGELYWASALISPIKNAGGKITHFVEIKEDITERKRMVSELIAAKERVERSDKLKSEFLALMSHEVRTPINVILNSVEMIREALQESMTENLKESFDYMYTSSKRIIRTIETILNMSEMQTGTYEAIFKNIDLVKDILENIYSEYIKKADQTGIEFSLIDKTDSSTILADEYSINQVFSHLIDNAVKYTKQGKVEIIVDRDNRQRLFVRVKDTGKGISKEYLPHIFELFRQEEQGYSRSFDGCGLGLALAKKYLEINNAEIFVESEKGKGTTFTVVFLENRT
ncbi:MAG: ATP-binding protein [Bacteroidota bacterium]